MQSDVWYELVLRNLSGTDQAMLDLLRDAETAQGAPAASADDARQMPPPPGLRPGLERGTGPRPEARPPDAGPGVSAPGDPEDRSWG